MCFHGVITIGILLIHTRRSECYSWLSRQEREHMQGTLSYVKALEFESEGYLWRQL